MYFYASTAGGGAMILPYPVEREGQAVKATAKPRPANDEQIARDVARYQNAIKQNRS